jgi:hypothetical protein
MSAKKKYNRVENMPKASFPVVFYDPEYCGTKASLTYREFQPWLWQLFVLFQRSMYFHIFNWDSLFVTVIIAVFVSKSVWEDIGNGEVFSIHQTTSVILLCHSSKHRCGTRRNSFLPMRAIMLREGAAGIMSQLISSQI